MKYIMKYSTHLLTLFTICLCIWGVLNWDNLTAIQLAVVGFSIFITLHEWEEMHFPGGFMEMMGDIVGMDISSKRPGAEHTSQSLLIAMIVILPILFPNAHWLFCGCMIFGIVEGIVHVVGIKMANTHKPYTPGMITGILMFIYSIIAIVIMYGQTSISVSSWVIGFIYFIVWFIIMEQLVMSFCQIDRKAFMKNMMAMVKKA